MSDNGIKGFFDYSVTGADKVAAMEARLIEVERHLGTALPQAAARTTSATERVAAAHAVSGERMAKYGTTALMLTGNMQRLGVQNELLSRTIGVGAEILTGATGGMYLAVASVGTLAAGISVLVMRHRDNEKAIKDSTDAMVKAIDANITLAALQNPTGAIARAYLGRNERDATSSVAGLEATYVDISQRRNFGGYVQRNTALIKGFAPATSFVPYNDKEKAELDKSASETAMALVIAKTNLLKIQSARYTIETTYGANGNGIVSGGATGKPSFNLWDSGIKQEGALTPRAGGQNAPGFGPGDLAKNSYAEAQKASAAARDAQVSDMQVVIETHRSGYLGMMAVTQSTQKASSMFVERALMGENVQRLKGLTVARYVASGAAAAVIRELGEKAEKKAAWEAAEAIASFAVGDMRGGGLHLAASAGYGALAGGAAGMASGLERSAQAQFDKETTRGGSSSGVAAGNGTAGLAGPGNPGVRIANSGASVGTVNYNFIVTYQGVTVYGDGGTRDWFYRELVPLINEGVSTGSISRN